MPGRKENQGADEVLDDFETITDRKPVTIRDVVRKHRANFTDQLPDPFAANTSNLRSCFT